MDDILIVEDDRALSQGIRLALGQEACGLQGPGGAWTSPVSGTWRPRERSRG